LNNVLQDICLTRNILKNTPKWKYVTRYKQTKRLDEDIIKFKNLDIFIASEYMITFLLSLDKEITKNLSIFVWYNDSLVLLEVKDNNNKSTNVLFSPRSNKFEISDKNVTYTIYRNTKISNNINLMWEPLTDTIKESYIKIITEISELI
jgi:hypothetical protein